MIGVPGRQPRPRAPGAKTSRSGRRTGIYGRQLRQCHEHAGTPISRIEAIAVTGSKADREG